MHTYPNLTLTLTRLQNRIFQIHIMQEGVLRLKVRLVLCLVFISLVLCLDFCHVCCNKNIAWQNVELKNPGYGTGKG